MTKNIDKLTMTICKICEIGHWVGMVILALAGICSVTFSQYLNKFISYDVTDGKVDLSAYGFEIIAPYSDGKIETRYFIIFVIAAVLIFTLIAMIFRNMYLILKKSQNTTPFQKDNIRMLREIGIFSIAIPLIGYTMAWIAKLVIGIDAVECSVDSFGTIIGLAVLCLTQFFAHGAELEKDVEGLV